MGWPSVAWGLRRISSRELTEWHTFYVLEERERKAAEAEADRKARLKTNGKDKPQFLGRRQPRG